MLAIFYGCGLRRNEGVSLDVPDINFDRSILHVRKGKGYKGYKSFGKAVGKGLNYYSNEDYGEACGEDYYNDCYKHDQSNWDAGFMGHLAMMLERGSGKRAD